MAVITGSFNSLVSGTISGVFQNTAGGVLSGVIGTPGPQGSQGEPGQGVPVGGSAGQALVKIDGTNYNTEWSSLPAFLTKAGNLSGLTDLSVARDNLNLGQNNNPIFARVDLLGTFPNGSVITPNSLSITSSVYGSFAISPASGITFPDATVQTTAYPGGIGNYLLRANNLSDLTDLSVARQNINLGSSDTPVFGGVDAGSGANVAHLSPTALSLTQFGHGQFTIQPSQGIVWPDASVQTTAWNDAPSDGTIYGRQDGDWVEAGGGAGVYLPLAGGSMDLDAQIELSSTGGSYLSFAGSVINLSVGNDDTNIEPGKIQLYFEYVLTPLTIDVNGITFPDATVQTTAFTDVYLPLSGGTMTGGIYFNDANSYITHNAVVQSFDGSEGGSTEGQQYYASYANDGLVFKRQDWVNGPEGPPSEASYVYGVALGATGLRFINFNGSTRGSTTQYLSTGITFPDATVQTTAAVTPDLSGYAPLASPAFTGNVTITSNSASPALSITQDGAGDIIQFKDVTSDTTYSFIDAAGKVNTIASTTANAGFRIPVGPAPTAPVDGDIWSSSLGLVIRLSGVTQNIPTAGLNNVFTGVNTFTSTLNYSGSNSNYGTATGASTIGISVGATTNGSTKTLNLGTGGLAGSFTNVTIGSTTGTSTTTLQGITNGVTQTAGNNSTALATTAFVTAAIPAFATNAQAVAASSTTTALSPFNSRFSQLAPFVFAPVTSSLTSVTSGGGSSTMSAYGGSIGSSGSAAGYVLRHTTPYMRGQNVTAGIQWQKPQMFAVRIVPYFAWQTASIFRMTLGSNTATLNVLANKGIGISFGASATNTLSALVLDVHNGTTFTPVTSSFTPVLTQGFDVMVYSDGAGNVTLYVNDVQVATTSAGPTTAAIANYNILQIGIENTTTLTTGSNLGFNSLKTFIS